MKIKKKSWFFCFIFLSLFFIIIPFTYHFNHQNSTPLKTDFLISKIQNIPSKKKSNFISEENKLDLIDANNVELNINNDNLKANQNNYLKSQNINDTNRIILTNKINWSDKKDKKYSYFSDKNDNEDQQESSDAKHKVLISLLATLVLILTITLITLVIKKVHEVKNPTSKPD